MKISRISFITVILSSFILSVRSQTICERMQKVANDLPPKVKERLPEDKVATDADVTYLLEVLSSTDKALERLVAGVTDREVLKYYHFAIMASHSTVARALLEGEKLEKAYPLLSSISDMVFALDDDILKNSETIHCIKTDESRESMSVGDYQEFAVNYYACYMSSCCFLNKMEEADKLFDHVAKYNLWNVQESAYTTAAIYVHSKWANHVADDHRVVASDYLLKLYTEKSVRDSVTMPINTLLQSLNDPALVDTTMPNRANELYLIYQDIHFFRFRNKDYDVMPEQVESDMFAQAMSCMTYHTNIPELLETMKYNNHPVVDRIINMNDPELLNKVIFMFEQYIQRAGKNLREPYFWQNMAKFYARTGNTDAEKDALKKAKKYKY